MKVLKTVFLMAVLLFLVLMGVYNRGKVDFQFPPVLGQHVRQPAAVMYFGFFAVGVLTGTVWALGNGKGKRSAANPNKPS